MRLLIVAQYFWPENFRINDIAQGLQKKGHEVSVLTGKPNYPLGSFYEGYSMFAKRIEKWNGITIYRVPLIPRGNGKGKMLFLNYISFIFFGCIRAFFLPGSYDAILIYQQSPITVAFPAMICKLKSGAKSFLYVQDLWPESIEATTGIKSQLVKKILYRLCNWIYSQADILLIQSKAFRTYLISRKVVPEKIIYLPNSTEALYNIFERNTNLDKYFSSKLTLVFAGNIGEAQSFDTLIAAAKLVKATDPDISWLILGDGRRREELIKLVRAEKIDDVFNFAGFFESSMMPEFFASADALIISLKKDFIFSLTVPTKLQSYMACGKPIIGSLDGEGGLIILGADCGFVSAAEDAEGLAKNILLFKRTSITERRRMGLNGFNYFQKEFEYTKLLDRIENILSN